MSFFEILPCYFTRNVIVMRTPSLNLHGIELTLFGNYHAKYLKCAMTLNKKCILFITNPLKKCRGLVLPNSCSLYKMPCQNCKGHVGKS